MVSDERLAKQIKEDVRYIQDCDCTDDISRSHANIKKWTQEELELLQELQSYREKQAKGLLIELPCKVGDIVFYPDEKCELSPFCDRSSRPRCYACEHLTKVISQKEFSLSNVGHIGKDLFLTEAEAQKALEEQAK